MDRKEAYYNIKQFGYGPELQKKFGKPYSSVSSAELIPAVDEMMKKGKVKNEVAKPKKENPKPEKKEDEDKLNEDKLSFDGRIKLGRQYIDKINALKARKEYMEKSLEIITTRNDLSIRISSGGSIGYYTFRQDGGLEYKYGPKSYPNFITSMYYFTNDRSNESLGVFPLSEIISNEDNIKLIQDEYISLYKDENDKVQCEIADELIKEFETKFAEL